MANIDTVLDYLKQHVSREQLNTWRRLDRNQLSEVLFDACNELAPYKDADGVRASLAFAHFGLFGEDEIAERFSSVQRLMVTVLVPKGADQLKEVLYSELFKCWEACEDDVLERQINEFIIRRDVDNYIIDFIRGKVKDVPALKAFRLLECARNGYVRDGYLRQVHHKLLIALLVLFQHLKDFTTDTLVDMVLAGMPYLRPHLGDKYGSALRAEKIMAEHRERARMHVAFIEVLWEEVASYPLDNCHHPMMVVISISEVELVIELNISDPAFGENPPELGEIECRLREWYGKYEKAKPRLKVIPIDEKSRDVFDIKDIFVPIPEKAFTID